MIKSITIAIDGPAASGKGSLARRLAEAHNLAHLDTGKLYRAVGFEVLEAGGDPENDEDAALAADRLQDKIEIAKQENADGPLSILSLPVLGEDHVAQAASKVAAQQVVRDKLINLQRNFAKNPGGSYQGAVLDGRDIGTVICPDADVKLYIEAAVEVRAERRMKELQSRSIDATKRAVLADLRERDARDSRREVAPMRPADDAIMLDTSKMSADDVFEKAMQILEDRL